MMNTIWPQPPWFGGDQNQKGLEKQKGVIKTINEKEEEKLKTKEEEEEEKTRIHK